jgi:hypothetical protein
MTAGRPAAGQILSFAVKIKGKSKFFDEKRILCVLLISRWGPTLGSFGIMVREIDSKNKIENSTWRNFALITYAGFTMVYVQVHFMNTPQVSGHEIVWCPR